MRVNRKKTLVTNGAATVAPVLTRKNVYSTLRLNLEAPKIRWDSLEDKTYMVVPLVCGYAW